MKIIITEEQLQQYSSKEFENYMVKYNLKKIHKRSSELLKLSNEEIDQALVGHQWAVDHIATAADDLDEAGEFIIQATNKEMHHEFEKIKPSLCGCNPHSLNESYNWNITEAVYKGKTVSLNKPFRQASGGKKFAVYVKSPSGNIKKVRFGAQGYRVRNANKKAATSFRKRHRCDQKKDKTTPGYWSCNISRYRKQLGISSSSSW